ncbi:hypothetical protein BGY98DRAFT_1099021 [Russula aff. rugulosa BPL654]|nr:hypothetical protein BGY98DRAFT_1099021 [Russula aff. rugulosa BPL654]
MYTDPQLSEETFSAAGGLDPSLQSILVRGHDEGAGISYTDNISLLKVFVLPQTRLPRQALWKEEHEQNNAGMREVLERPYLCNSCGELYAQPQGINRHYRAKLDPSSYIYCGAKRSHPYEYRNHIEKRHRDIDPVSGKVAGSRGEATAIGREQPPAKAVHVSATFFHWKRCPTVDHASRLPPARPGGSTTPDH